MNQARKARERKDVIEEQKREMMKNLPEEMKDLMEKKDETSTVPEWKWDFWPKDVGFRTKLSLKE